MSYAAPDDASFEGWLLELCDGHSLVSPYSDTELGILYISPGEQRAKNWGLWSLMSIHVRHLRALASTPQLQKSLWALAVFLPALFQEVNLFRWLYVFIIHYADSLSRACGFYWQRFEKNFQIMDENVD